MKTKSYFHVTGEQQVASILELGLLPPWLGPQVPSSPGGEWDCVYLTGTLREARRFRDWLLENDLADGTLVILRVTLPPNTDHCLEPDDYPRLSNDEELRTAVKYYGEIPPDLVQVLE